MNDQPTNDAGELQRTDEHSQVDVAPPKTLTKERLMAGASVTAIVPRSFEEVWRIAQLAVKSGLAPRDIKNPERAAIAIMHGLEIGLPPMAALQRIAVINNRPCVWGDAVPGIALSTKQLVEWSEDITGTGDDMIATCRVVRWLGTAGATTISKIGTFSVADAKKADLWDERAKVKRKDYQTGEFKEVPNDSPWHCYPKRMLQMRARVAFRDLFADALCGLYIAEELVGRDSDAQMRDVTPQYERIANPLGGNGDEVPDKIIGRGASGGGGGEGSGHVLTQDGKIVEVHLDAARKSAGAFEAGMAGSRPQEQKVSPGPPIEAGDGKKRKRTRPDGGTVAEGSPDSTGPGNGTTGSVVTAPPRPSGEEAVWNVAFPTPWQRQSSASYVSYALGWMAVAPSQVMARSRWDTERAIRNNIANPLDKAQQVACQEALAKVGG